MIRALRCRCRCAAKFSRPKTPPDPNRSVRFRGGNLYPFCRWLRSPPQPLAALIPHAGMGSFSPDDAAMYAGFLKAPGQETGFTGTGSYSPRTIDLLVQVATAG